MQETDLVRVLRKNVGEAPKLFEMEPGLDAMREIVGGFIECVALPHNIDLWLNDEGQLEQLPLNLLTYVDGQIVHDIVGNIFFASHDGKGGTVSLRDKQVAWIMDRMLVAGKATPEFGEHAIYGLIVK